MNDTVSNDFPGIQNLLLGMWQNLSTNRYLVF